MGEIGNQLRDLWAEVRLGLRALRRQAHDRYATALAYLDQWAAARYDALFGSEQDDPLLTPDVDPNAPPTLVPQPHTPKRDGKPQPQHTLHVHLPRPHTVRNAQEVVAEQRQQSFNARLAVLITKHVGTMMCAYLFAAIGISSLVGVATNNVVVTAVFGAFSSYFLQLVLLPIISVGTEQLSQHQEAQSQQQFLATQNTLHDGEQMMVHLDAQDAVLIAQNQELYKQTVMLTQIVAHLTARAGNDPPRSPSPPEPPPAAESPVPAPTDELAPRRRHRPRRREPRIIHD